MEYKRNLRVGVEGYTDDELSLDVYGNVNVSGNISAAGTVTYDDVTNVDSIGLVTARTGINVLANGINVSSGIVTAPAFTGFNYLQAPHSDSTVNYSVTVAAKTTAHRYEGTGSGNGYVINGVESPFLTLTPGRTYRFTLSSSDMSSHPFRFYLEADRTTAYTTNVTSTSTYTEIVVTDETPAVLHYQCSAHSYMGNAVQINSNAVNTPYQIEGLSGAYISGNVGIGITNPQYKLHVTGGGIDLNSSNTSSSGAIRVGRYIIGQSGQKLSIINQSNGILLEGTASATLTVSASGIVFGSAPIKFYSSDWTIYNNPTITLGGSNQSANIVGNVGLGSALPIAKLDVNGTVALGSSVYDANGTFGTNGQVLSNVTGFGVSWKTVSGSSVWSTSGNDAYYTTGNIGIGTANPTEKLDVNGNVNVVGVLTAERLYSNVYGEFTGGGISGTNIVGTSLSISGISTFTGNIDANGNLDVDGHTELDNLNVSGISTLGTLQVSNDVNVVGVLTAERLYSNVHGEFTGGGISGTNITGTSLNISGISTLGTLQISSGIVTATSGIITYYGDGSGLTNTNFNGASKSVVKYVATDGQTTFVATYELGYVDVYLNGVKLTADLYTSTSGTSIVLNDGAAANDVIEIVSFTFIEPSEADSANNIANKASSKYTATDGQTSFAATYEIGYVDVYLNGVKLTDDLYDATSGSAVVLNDGAAAGDIVEIIAFTFHNFNVGIQSGGSLVGSAKTINFAGSGISSVTVSSNIATINIEGSSSGINPIVANIVF